MKTAPKSKQEKSVHELRLTVKRLRALTRLLTPLGLERARGLDRDLRRVGRRLSPARDLAVTTKWLVRHGFEPARPAHPPHPDLPSAVRHLERLHRELLARMPKAAEDDLKASLAHHAKKAEKAAVRARRKPSDERFHEWRKRAKDLLYQLEWVERKRGTKKLEQLTKLLGRAQDSALVQASPLPRTLRKARKLAKKEKKKYWRKALSLGDQALNGFVRDIH